MAGIYRITWAIARWAAQYAWRHYEILSNALWALPYAVAAATLMPPSLIDCYQAVEDGSRRMLQAAHAGDWRGVAAIENDCKRLIQELKLRAFQLEARPGHPAPLTREEQAEKQRIMRRILGVDAQIRCLTEPWPLGQLVAGGPHSDLLEDRPADRPQLLH
jgi:flagellar protein FliT